VAYLGDKAGIESAVKYLIQGALGSSLILLGIGILYGQFGTLNMADIAGNIDSVHSISIFLPLVLMITGFGVEAAIFPLNAWLPDAHSSAPSSISAILSGIAIEVGLYAMVRIVFTVFGASSLFLFLVFLGVLTLLIGEMCAFSQDNIKRMLAYSSIGQIGLIVFAERYKIESEPELDGIGWPKPCPGLLHFNARLGLEPDFEGVIENSLGLAGEKKPPLDILKHPQRKVALILSVDILSGKISIDLELGE